jgi:hypothetical protein
MLGVAVTVTMLAVGCGSSESASNKAGGAAAPVTLKMASAYGDLNGLPAVAYFVSQVKDRSARP